jgi:hypothetical protein
VKCLGIWRLLFSSISFKRLEITEDRKGRCSRLGSLKGHVVMKYNQQNENCVY